MTEQRPLLRVALAAVVVADLISFYFFVSDARAAALAAGFALGDAGELLSRPAVSAVMILLGVAGAVAFALRAGRIWCGALPLAVLIVLSTVHAQLFGSPWRHLYYSGICLSGWLLGLVVGRRRGMPIDESYARIGSTAMLGAAYFNSGISKLTLGGLDWLSGLPIQAAVVAQDGLVADSVVSTYRSWIVNTPAVASLFSVLTVGFELAGPLMIAGRRARLCVALGLLAMHANIYVMMPILYWESMVLLLLFGFAAERRDAEIEPQPVKSIFAQGPAFAVTVVLLTLCAVVAISHQALRFARAQNAMTSLVRVPSLPAEFSEPPASGTTPSTSPPLLKAIGPFVLGQVLTGTWSIAGLAVTENGVVVALAGPPGRIRFEVTCRSEHRSPFDLGDAHILYSQHVEFPVLEEAGWALQRLLKEAVPGGDVCSRLADWRMSAR